MKIKRKGKLALFIIGILLFVVAIPHVFADHKIANSLPVSDESESIMIMVMIMIMGTLKNQTMKTMVERTHSLT